MQITSHSSLKPYNTMQLDVQAEKFVDITHEAQLYDLAHNPELGNLPWFILGGGSNVLFTKDIGGLVVKLSTQGRKKIKETDKHVWLEVAAGETWHTLVESVVEAGWGGIENLALIPGGVGAAPVQNIAAYGQQVADAIESVTYFDRATKNTSTLAASALHFGYRDSIFKHELKDRAIITQVVLRLDKHPTLETDYYSLGRRRDSLTQELAELAQPPFRVKDIFKAVVSIRSKKLPDWKQVPTVGSFFKNPIISKQDLATLQEQVSDLQYYPVETLTYRQLTDPSFDQEDFVKVPAGRLLDELGWGQKRIGHVHTYNNWASIVTHDGQATGQEVQAYTEAMKADVLAHYGIELEAEVNVL